MKAQAYLTKNPSVKVVFESSDGFLFRNEQDAKNHAKTLKNSKVKAVVKEKETTKKVEEPKAEQTAPVKETKKVEGLKKVAKNTSKETEIVSVDLDGLKLIPENYKKMKVFAKSIGLVVEGNKADDYIKALEAYKKTKSE